MKNILFAGISLLLTISVQAQNGETLKMNLEKNRVYRLMSVSSQTVTQTINGVQQTTESKAGYTMSLKMLEATPDFMVTEVRFDTLVTTTNTMGRILTISSANEGDIRSEEMAEVLSCIMNRLSKNALYVKIDYTGKPVEIVNAGMLSGIILKDTSSISVKGPAAQAVKKQVIETVSEESLRSMIAMFTHYLPGGEVAKGNQWSITQQMNSGGMMLDIITTYRLDGSDGTLANITAESAIKASENAAPIESGGATVTYGDLKGMSRATMVIDINSGMRVEENSKTHISGNLGISAAGLSMQMPMDINGESKITLIQ
jgi:hypothetical protein